MILTESPHLLVEEVLVFPVVAKLESKVPVLLLKSDKERGNYMFIKSKSFCG